MATKAKTKKITLGENANYFHDSFTGITLAKGDIKEVEERQLRTKRIRNAFATGHLAYPTLEDSGNTDEEALDVLVTKIKLAATSGKDVKKTAAMFSTKQLEAIAESLEIEPEETDTKETLVEAIFGKVSNK